MFNITKPTSAFARYYSECRTIGRLCPEAYSINLCFRRQTFPYCRNLLRQKTVIFGPITVAHAVGAFGGFFLGQALGDNPWVVLACVVLGLALTTLRVRGLTPTCSSPW